MFAPANKSNRLFNNYFSLKHRNSSFYPFGSALPGRTWSDAGRIYRFGFNGKEKDAETATDNYDFGARIYDGRLGRWLSLDPEFNLYVWQSCFAYFKNCPVYIVDFEGKGEMPPLDLNEDNLDWLKQDSESESISIFEDYYVTDNTSLIVAQTDMQLISKGRPLISKYKIKVRNHIDIQEFRINSNYSTKFKVKGKNKVRVQFNAAGEPDQLQVFRIYLFIFKKEVKNTGMITGVHKDFWLGRGRYKVKVTHGPRTPTTYHLKINGALVRRKEVHKHKGDIIKLKREKTKWISYDRNIPDRGKIKNPPNIPSNAKN